MVTFIGKSLVNQALTLRYMNSELDYACERYLSRVDDTLKLYGMTVDNFNDMSNTLNKSPFLKKKVLLQAYYYK